MNVTLMMTAMRVREAYFNGELDALLYKAVEIFNQAVAIDTF